MFVVRVFILGMSLLFYKCFGLLVLKLTSTVASVKRIYVRSSKVRYPATASVVAPSSTPTCLFYRCGGWFGYRA